MVTVDHTGTWGGWSPKDVRRVEGAIRRFSYRALALDESLFVTTIAYMSSTESLRTVREHFSEFVDRVEQHHDRIIVTRNGRPAAVILSLDDLAELEETIDVLRDVEALGDIREGDAAYRQGDVVRGVESVRALRSS